LNVRPKQRWITGPPPGVKPYSKRELQTLESSLDHGEDGEGGHNKSNTKTITPDEKSRDATDEKIPDDTSVLKVLPIKNVTVDTENVTVIPSMTMNPGEQLIVIGDGGATLASHRSSNNTPNTTRSKNSRSKNSNLRTPRDLALQDDLNVNHYSK
jgi:hypothetical protein